MSEQEIDYKVAFANLEKFIAKEHFNAIISGYAQRFTRHHDMFKFDNGQEFILYHVFYRNGLNIFNYYYFYHIQRNEITWYTYDNEQPHERGSLRNLDNNIYDLTYINCMLDKCWSSPEEERKKFYDFSCRCESSIEYDLVQEKIQEKDSLSSFSGTCSEPRWYVSKEDRANEFNRFKLDY